MTELKLPEEYYPYILNPYDMPTGWTLLCFSIGEHQQLDGFFTKGGSYKVLAVNYYESIYSTILTLQQDNGKMSGWHIENFTERAIWLRQDTMPEKLLFKLKLLL